MGWIYCILYQMSSAPLFGKGGFCSGHRGCCCSKWCWTVPFCLPAGGFALRPLRASFQSAFICVYLTDVEEPHVAEKKSGVGGRCSPLSVWMFAPRGSPGPVGPVGSTAGGKSLHAAARSRIPAKFGRFLRGLCSPSPHACAFLSPIAGLRFVRSHAGEA